MGRAFFISFAAFLAASSAFAAPPAGVPAGGGARPDFAGSGRPDVAVSQGASASAGGQSTAASSSGGRSSSHGNSSNAGSFPSGSNAGGQGLSHAAPQAQGTLQALDTAFSEGEISLIREYFTTRAHANKDDGEAASAPATSTSSTFKKGQKLSSSYMAETLPADLLAKLPNRPGLTYLRVGDTILMLAGPEDVIVDIIDANSIGGGG
jgi:hypothetical protein